MPLMATPLSTPLTTTSSSQSWKGQPTFFWHTFSVWVRGTTAWHRGCFLTKWSTSRQNHGAKCTGQHLCISTNVQSPHRQMVINIRKMVGGGWQAPVSLGFSWTGSWTGTSLAALCGRNTETDESWSLSSEPSSSYSLKRQLVSLSWVEHMTIKVSYTESMSLFCNKLSTELSLSVTTTAFLNKYIKYININVMKYEEKLNLLINNVFNMLTSFCWWSNNVRVKLRLGSLFCRTSTFISDTQITFC